MGANLVCAVNATLMSLIYLSLGVNALGDETPASKFLWLGSEFGLNFAFFYDFFERHNHGAVTETLTLPCFRSKLAMLNHHAERASRFVRDAKDGTIQVLYREVFGGL